MPLRLFSSLRNTFRHIYQMNEKSLINKPKYNGKIKKRNWEDRRAERLTEHVEKRQKVEGFTRIKKRKFAILLGYSGVDYYGMQRNPNMRTIEEDLLNAFLKCNLVDDDSFNQVQNIQFQRAARTDKGVSAARQLVSLKMPEKYDTSEINSNLPAAIKVFSIKRVTKGFNSKSNCDARTYIYMLPTIAFSSFQESLDPESYRIDESALSKVNETLKLFCGTKNFHNFTSRKQFRDPSALRYIISFECEAPFVKENIEFAIIKIKGQSFMLHQIRKMVGLTIAVVRGHTTVDTIARSWTSERLDIPMAPGLGLILEYLHYDRYNERYGSDHDKLEWNDLESEINLFKEEHIYPTIINTEINEKSMISWLQTLPCHSFDVREEELEEKTDDNQENDSKDESGDNVENKLSSSVNT